MKMTEMFKLPNSRNQDNHQKIKILYSCQQQALNKNGMSQTPKINQETVFKIQIF